MHRQAGREARAEGRSAARSPRWCATRSAIAAAPLSRSAADCARRHRSGNKQVGDGADAPRPRPRSAGSTRCCRPRCWPRRCGRRSTRPSSTVAHRRLLDTLRAAGANLERRQPRPKCSTPPTEPLDDPRHHRRRAGPLPRARAQRASLLRAVDCTSAVAAPVPRTDARAPRRRPSSTASHRSQPLKRLASKYGMAPGSGFARRFIAGETIEEAIAAVARPAARRACS